MEKSKNRYSDADLAEFKTLIQNKLKEAHEGVKGATVLIGSAGETLENPVHCVKVTPDVNVLLEVTTWVELPKHLI